MDHATIAPSSSANADTRLGISGFTFADLHDPERLASLYERFCEDVQAADPSLWREWNGYRANPDAPRPPIAVSHLYVAMAPHLSRFITRLFQVGAGARAIAAATTAQDDLFRFKIDFVRRRALPLLKDGHVVSSPQDDALVQDLIGSVSDGDVELALARAGCALLDREKAEKEAVLPQADALKRWCAARLHDAQYRHWVIFRFPETLDYWHLVETTAVPGRPESVYGPDTRLRRRDGFRLTDMRMASRDVLSEIHYCVLCHERDKDSCSKGLHEPAAKDAAATTVKKLAVNPLGIELAGCPLDEKISEMHTLRKAGDAIGALAIVTVDNPMCPGTGHRICNDCMKSCIYQKQEPVNIPQIETGVLTDVLKMPWGVEIYGLLTRWNPLNVRRPFALPYNGKNVLVVGLGPAGYTLAHYLVNEGFGVVGVDGLKIEPLPDLLVGSDAVAPQPIQDWSEIYRSLDERVLEGFGGVSEYGITVRWDKNFLTLIHLTLARRRGLKIYGGVRFGGTLPIDDAWTYGFDHVAIAAGAGRPTIIEMKNNLIRGIRKASDFLMALQLTGAFKRDALPNLQARLPAVVIGGGLTAIDTATELMAYYPIQVEKTITQYEELSSHLGEARLRGMYDPEELELLDEFRTHGRAVRDERARAKAAGEAPSFVGLVRGWGGVTIAYRKRMVDSPAYRLNHEEVIKALEEGIGFAENLNPLEAIPDERGALTAVRFAGDKGREGQEAGEITLSARTMLVAAGTSPNVTYEKEAPSTFQLDAKKKFFQPHRVVKNASGFTLEPDAQGFFTSHARDGRFVSYYGDNHPRYAGNVVKAMASAKDGFPKVVELFGDELSRLTPHDQPARDQAWQSLTKRLDEDFIARVERVERLTPTIVEVVVKAPAAARHFHPGQFYRLQNFESSARRVDHGGHAIPLLMEGIALTGAWVDKEKGLLSLIALELGVSSRLVARLKSGEQVIVMGPTGAPTDIPEKESVLLLGGGLGNAVLFSIAKAMRDRGNRVLYFAGYKKGEDLFKREEIEAATDQVIWSTDIGAAVTPGRPQDAHFRGNIVQAMLAYQAGELGKVLVPLNTVDRIIAIGSDRMMAAVKAARHGVLAPHLKNGHTAIASINSPMQCMMKEVCAQCLQKHVDPATGKESIIFSCFNQDQDMDRVDFPNLAARLRQNTVQEKLSNLWFDYLLHADV
ncbi:MAG TPA: FAD-dependent oxidoreductase [Vicinamibacterales bacterium]|jgi:NADPH-dependent glutamate synthase beta subunit-like oxidoreductase/NAD(P)H-flavin reductase|nr:FAD-dependent oxidoreductase [Vicinamibacterales bacterium]